MKLRHLRYRVAVAEELNVRQAATRLHLSQPPLSRQIHDLEDEVGTKLFVRSKSGMRLTEAGRTFLKEARSILAQSQRAVQPASRGEASPCSDRGRSLGEITDLSSIPARVPQVPRVHQSCVRTELIENDNNRCAFVRQRCLSGLIDGDAKCRISICLYSSADARIRMEASEFLDTALNLCYTTAHLHDVAR
jgi:DNA-binding transcriptional LysR family regulator